MASRGTVFALLLAAAFAAGAQVLQQADDALRADDPARAIALLQDAAAKGDAHAKGRLSALLVNLPQPHRDTAKGCSLALEAAATGDSAGEATQAQCLLAGFLQAQDRFGKARELARKSAAQKDPAGSFALFLAFAADPRNHWRQDGKPDQQAYAALAARTVAERADQIEAYDALATAAVAGHKEAAVLLASYLFETAGPENAKRLHRYIPALTANGVRSPLLQQYASHVADMERLGNTQASGRAFLEAYKLAAAAASVSAGPQAENRSCRDVRMESVTSGKLEDHDYLPLKQPLVANSYLLKGKWEEQWSFIACGRSITLPVKFEADGWGGARFSVQPRKPS